MAVAIPVLALLLTQAAGTDPVHAVRPGPPERPVPLGVTRIVNLGGVLDDPPFPRRTVFTADHGSAGWLVPESALGRDLDGDGNTTGRVLHTVDFDTAEARNLKRISLNRPLLGQRSTAFTTHNGAGSPATLSLFDRARNVVLDTTIPIAPAPLGSGRAPYAFAGSLLVARVDEAGAGDQNGDGDVTDGVLRVIRTRPPRLAGESSTPWLDGTVALACTDFALAGNVVIALVSEPDHFGEDRNGDADADDRSVLALVDPASGAVRNLGLAVARFLPPADDAASFLFTVSEAGQRTDLNFDGDVEDDVVHAIDVATGRVTNLALAGGPVDSRGRWFAISVRESDQGDLDRNGDGDALDDVLVLYDADTGVLFDSRTSLGRYAAIAANAVFFQVDEAAQGEDANGDGDLEDTLVHALDLSSGAVASLGLSASMIEAPGDLVAFFVREPVVGHDLNGDGDAADGVAVFYDPSSGRTFDTERALDFSDVGFFDFDLTRGDGPRVAFLVQEAAQGEDLDGDGLAHFGTSVLHVLDARTGAVTNTGLNTTNHGFVLSGDVLVVAVNEWAPMGGADLNGNGIVSDHVPHLVYLE